MNHSIGDNSDDNESWSVYRKRREDYYKGKEKIGHSENKRHSGSSGFQKDEHMEVRFQSRRHDHQSYLPYYDRFCVFCAYDVYAPS
jgi:hypothetical protein